MLSLLVVLALAPPRVTGADVSSAQSVATLRECIDHAAGSTEDLETDKGVLITIGSTTNILGMHKTGPVTIGISDEGENRHLTVLYRHPFSNHSAIKFLQSIGKKCFPYELAASSLAKD